MLTTRQKVYTIIFGTTTRPGRRFDLLLLILIVLSVITVILESTKPLRTQYSDIFVSAEWFFTIIFTVEYLLRVYAHPKPLKYMTSFLGIIDLVAILPAYLGLFFEYTSFMLTVRAFRLLRVFRILKLTRYITEMEQLTTALRKSFLKMVVFFEVVLVMVLFMGTIMYMIEGEESGFTSIPQSIYWAIVTITTVGYGDIAPVTVVGKMIASFAMLTGYAIIAVPTGIVTFEIGRISSKDKKRNCPSCGYFTKDPLAEFCNRCGSKLE